MNAADRKIVALKDEIARLQHLLKSQMRAGDELEFEGIVNESGVPKVNLRWDQLAAQLSVDDARQLGIDLLTVSLWAETDAKMFAAAVKEFGLEGAAGVMAILRQGRGGRRDASA